MSLVKNKTSFTPPSGRNVNLDTYITTSKTFISNMNKEHNFIKHNITLEQRKAIKVLSEDESIIIKEADKGGGIVIMNVDFYKSKVLEMLTDVSYYKSIPNSNTKTIFSEIKDLIKGSNMTKQEIDYLLNFDCKTSTFYGLPKIHKSKIIQNICNKENADYIKIVDPNDLQL